MEEEQVETKSDNAGSRVAMAEDDMFICLFSHVRRRFARETIIC